MKKIFENLYFFSKLSTSIILLLCILALGYFFFISFKNQEKSNKDQLEFYKKLNTNTENISNLSKKTDIMDSKLSEIKKLIENNSNKKIDDEIIFLNNKIQKLNSKLENILINLKEINSNEISSNKKTQNVESSNNIYDNNKLELSKLVIFKFENSLDFSEELAILEKLNDQNKYHIFEKINLVRSKGFRGNLFLKNVFAKELDYFLKDNFNYNSNNFFSKSLMNLIVIEPSKINTIKNNDISILNEVSNYLEQKKYKNFHEKIININNYEKYFVETISQMNIIIEFEDLIKKVS